MFKNEYKDVFGATYTSKVWDKAQKANNWSMAFALLYALSKNGMNYASATTGACSVISSTSIPCRCQMTISGPNATKGTLRVWFGTRLCIKIPVISNGDGTKAYPSGIFVADAHYSHLRNGVRANLYSVCELDALCRGRDCDCQL